MRFWTTTFIISATLFFFLHTVVLAADVPNCPKLDSPKVTAVKYQLFAAYNIGYDGHQLPCELKCMGKADCQNSCQTKEALRLLQAKLVELSQKETLASNSAAPCPSFSETCMDQCKADGPACLAACGKGPSPIAQQ